MSVICFSKTVRIKFILFGGKSAPQQQHKVTLASLADGHISPAALVWDALQPQTPSHRRPPHLHKNTRPQMRNTYSYIKFIQYANKQVYKRTVYTAVNLLKQCIEEGFNPVKPDICDIYQNNLLSCMLMSWDGASSELQVWEFKCALLIYHHKHLVEIIQSQLQIGSSHVMNMNEE